MKVCMYLRKSRQDEELEKRENTDTLARHQLHLSGQPGIDDDRYL